MEQVETAYIQVFHGTDAGADTPRSAVVRDRLSGRTDKQSHIGQGQESTIIKVQFNPATLSFSTRDRSWEKKEKKRKKTSLIQSGQDEVATAFADTSDASVNVSFRLIFDRSTDQNADVQPDVENFLSLVRDPYVRRAAFCWGDLSYKGMLKNVEAEYVLFDASGRPVRATVNLTLEGV